MICIYHSRDLDGYASGAIVKLKYPDAKMIGYDYGQPFPWDKIPDMDDVIIIDVSLPMDDMERLAMMCSKFTFIDHHTTAIKDFQSRVWPGHVNAVLENGISACEGGWKYLFPNDSILGATRIRSAGMKSSCHSSTACVPFATHLKHSRLI